MKINKEREKRIETLCRYLGKQSATVTSCRCTGSWAGSTDYSLLFNDGTKMFISNSSSGSDAFDATIDEYNDHFHMITVNKGKMLELLIRYEKKDNELADTGIYGLKKYETKDIVFGIDSTGYVYIAPIIEIEGERYMMKETGIKYALYRGYEMLKAYLEEEFGRKRYIAAAVKRPTYIYHNVFHSHIDGIYTYKPYQSVI